MPSSPADCWTDTTGAAVVWMVKACELAVPALPAASTTRVIAV